MKRHYRDGSYLLSQGRHVTADHVLGFAAECAIKSMLVRFGIATFAGSGKPKIGNQALGHLPDLATVVLTNLAGRGAQNTAQQVDLLAREYRDWSVFDRYDGDSVQSPGRVRAREQVTRQVVALHEVARLAGGLT